MKEVQIRLATTEDAKQIAKVIKEAFLWYVHAAEIKTVEALNETYEDVAADIKNKKVYCALLDKKVIGSLRIEINSDNKTAYLSRFGVLLEYRNIGVGKKLMQAVDIELKSLGIQKLFLHTAINIPELISFYKKVGFQIETVSESEGYPRALLTKRP
ncbi:MAG: GNAT family N-acetyltransferase [Firmicutes bacterium]|nr:GNAT family N-acetyltransferase [Bacillota bacterium]